MGVLFRLNGDQPQRHDFIYVSDRTLNLIEGRGIFCISHTVSNTMAKMQARVYLEYLAK